MAMLTLFHGMMHKEIKVYVDDIIGKLRNEEDHLRLNLAKCTFVDKVRAIFEMPPPRTKKEVQGFLGRLNYIAWFISQLMATCELIFKFDTCEEAFEKIKQYLQNPPILVLLVLKRPPIVYLTMLDRSMGCVLG
ncbi:Tf2-9, partial [Mucuna pruriens]